jgi:hypothetical protein
VVRDGIHEGDLMDALEKLGADTFHWYVVDGHWLLQVITPRHTMTRPIAIESTPTRFEALLGALEKAVGE